MRASASPAATTNGNNGLVTTTGTAAGNDTQTTTFINGQNAINNAINSGTTPVPLPTRHPGRREPLQREPAGRQPRRLASRWASSAATTRRPGAVGRAGRDAANIISSPRVITANQKEATIEQGVEIPYQESASSGATTIQFKKAVLSLKVTPQITPDNRIILDLDVKEDSVGQVIVASGGINVPSIDTREITTQVLVNDGQTVVLGGILETTEREDDNKVPYLGDIPVLGNLFKQTTHKDNKDELMIFVTPKIVREGITAAN